jgi:Tol biopolymer transport system component
VLADRQATWSDAQQLTFDNALVEFLDLSPDGTRLAVSSDRRGNPDIWIMPSGGGEMQQFTTDPTPDWDPAWSPDGREIAFYAYRSGNREIWVQPVGGGPARQLTKGEADSVFPRWSPNGKTIIFASRTSGPSDIWTVPAAGGAPAFLTGEPTFEDTDPFWSRDGQWVLFRSNRSGRPEVWRVPAGGGAPQPIFEGGASPTFSPDGREIYYLGPGPADQGGRAIWVASADGKASRPLTALTGRRGSLNANALSTDGRFVYFTWAEGASDVWVMDLEPSR